MPHCPFAKQMLKLRLDLMVIPLQLFETGVDEMSWDDLSHAREDWPPVADVTEYRRKAYQVIRKVGIWLPSQLFSGCFRVQGVVCVK